MALDIIHNAPSFAERTTLGLGGTGLAQVTVRKEKDLEALPSTLERLGGKPVVLGRGSNILARDGLLDLVAVRAEADAKFSVQSNRVLAGAALRLPMLLARLAAEGLSGLEGLSGIPGNVGGAVAMNAGSFGCEFKDCLRRVRVFTPERGLEWRTPDTFAMGYRHFCLNEEPDFFLILGVELELAREDPGRVREHMRESYAKKKAVQPLGVRSAGCVFKNPEQGLSAGILLDKAGFRGKSLGGVALSDKHANFLINTGGGTSAQAFELLDMARQAVARQFGHTLEMEVKVWPCK